ncbi:methylcrotonoyl-CoA carboxylase subunit alpha, mitochondrial isoform X3 [Rosa chinensis]|uniref:methylcrotonoyl-CoA carboxylase subunit alpha, mitochondrial isoform X3 n=1 Tax=Rosa chinensis TaxID=74649 RepID=UPI001AD91923|nr:methylcrotonoyl-CoA carboxylase subunit alpha, mitochondrial isoform X3 [Rosa chinensis]
MASVATVLRRKLSGKPFHFRLLPVRPFSDSPQRIEKILIANRGEIACRIMRTAKRLGIQTVAVFSDADRHSLHVKSADEAVRIGPAPARLSYLDASSILDAAVRTGAQAIHPGYGFLSESSDFAQLCEDKGLTFIGPPASAIRDMGDKSASKRIMGAAGVPLVPGYHGKDQDIDLMKIEADKIGYPILIKPTHGGGGKGMRIVQSPDEFVEAFLGAQREAAASFGVNTILLEKYITQPRHIEVQIFGDKHGNVLHLYERDCSVQRRHQKIIEEAPAPNVSNDFRSHLGQAAVSAAKAVSYHSAGTVEFIVDTVSGQFYFMEMNTRLQVEHPVTEMIVGQDLVEWQIRVANGEHLPISQSQVPLSGHAFEARIYAENVPKGFLPATGVLHHYQHAPVSPSAVRVETGVEQGDSVSMHYDPMIAKLVVWGENRAVALVKLKDCLTKFQVAGVPTNISFLSKLANHREFENGNVETHFIEHFKDDLFVNPSNLEVMNTVLGAARFVAKLAAACLIEKENSVFREILPGSNNTISIWYSSPPFRVNHCARHTVELEWENEYDSSGSRLLTYSITYKSDGSYLIEMLHLCVQTEEDISPPLEVKATCVGDHDFRVEADGVIMDVSLAVYSKDQTKHIHLWHGSHHHHYRQKLGLELSDEDETEHRPSFDRSSHPPGTVVAPMAGLVVKVLIKDATKVEEGQPILVLEAMKMEHAVKAPSAGYVRGLHLAAGQQVSDGSVLFSIKAQSLKPDILSAPHCDAIFQNMEISYSDNSVIVYNVYITFDRFQCQCGLR